MCGSRDLTFEHIPPESCLNSEPVQDWDWPGVMSKFRNAKKYRRALGRYSLCRNCNNSLGSSSIPEQKRFTLRAQELISRSPGHPEVEAPIDLQPRLLARQLATMAVAMGSFEYHEHSWFQQLVQTARGLRLQQGEIGFWVYLNPTKHVRLVSGPTLEMTFGNGWRPSVLCEISRYPLGYVIMWDSDATRAYARALGLTSFTWCLEPTQPPEVRRTFRLRKFAPVSFTPLEYEGFNASFRDWA